MQDQRILASIGGSDNLDPIAAAREAAVQSLEKAKNPKVAIVFSTIHYEKKFNEVLSEIKKTVNAPIVGCTGAAVLTPERIYVRGLGVLCLSGELNVGVGIGKNSRINPEMAGEQAMKWLYKLWENPAIKIRTELFSPQE